MPIALIVLVMVAYNIYQRHFVQQQIGSNYLFDDLPTFNKIPVTADIDAIIKAHIFGLVPEKPSQAPTIAKKTPVKVVPKTRLNIKLTGIIDGDSPENGMAMLEVDRGNTLVVAVGEKIGKTDATLHQVLPGEVLVDREGTIESVKMVRKSLSVASLDPTLIDNLPQPFEQGNGNQQSGSEQNYSSGAPQSYQPPAGETVETEGSAIRTSNSGTDSSQNTTNSDNKLPIPAMLRN